MIPISAQKSPAHLPGHPQVVPRAAHHSMQRIARRTLEWISGQPAVHFHLLDRTAPMNHGLQGLGQSEPVVRSEDAFPLLDLHPLVALVHDGRASEGAHLVERLGQRVPVVRTLPSMLLIPSTSPSFRVVATLTFRPNS